MASHMGVQSFASHRNSHGEFLVHFILSNFFSKLEDQELLSEVNIEQQKSYSSEIAQDVWDHFVSAKQKNGRVIEIWCQTTCYKGNGTGRPEPNKTYEVRETLVEGISIRQLFKSDPEKDFRSIHFTIGDERYTYKWFGDLKSAAFDKSLYIGEVRYDIFTELSSVLDESKTETDALNALNKISLGKTKLGEHIRHANTELNNWWNKDKFPESQLANLLWKLAEDEFQLKNGKWPKFSNIRGMDIKGRTNQLLFSKKEVIENDPLIPKTAAKLLKKNPFLAAAVDSLQSWDSFCEKVTNLAANHTSLKNVIEALWNCPLPDRLIVRRLLLRIHSSDDIHYIQDREIQGVTEHGIYVADHNAKQTEEICSQIMLSLSDAKLGTKKDLLWSIRSRGKGLVSQARWFEAKNGTELKPSFNYVQLALEKNGFKVVNPSAFGVSTIGFHSELTTETVRSYTNLKLVLDKSGIPLCLLKAKFFRQPELPRRCKEEAFVGLTLKYRYKNGSFKKRLEIPLVMFVDMASDFAPPLGPLKRLTCFGWHLVFSIDELLATLE